MNRIVVIVAAIIAPVTIAVGQEPAQGDGACSQRVLARQTYPACRPGPGDDRCIQLYERGMDEQSPHQRTTGMPTGSAMGGPNHRGCVRKIRNDPVGTAPNDLVDTKGAGILRDNARGIDADEAEDPQR